MTDFIISVLVIVGNTTVVAGFTAAHYYKRGYEAGTFDTETRML